MTWEELPITEIEKVIGYEFKNKDLLRQAFTTLRYWYNKTTYDHDLLPYIGNAIIMDEIDNLVQENKLAKEKAAFIKQEKATTWLNIMQDTKLFTYLIYAPNEHLIDYQRNAEIITLLPLIVCAVYFDENYQVTNNVKNVVDKLLKHEFNWKD